MTLRGRFPWPVVALALGAAGATRTPAFLIVAAGGLVVWVLTELTARLALVAVDVALEVEPRRLVAGESVVAIVTLTNRKPVHLPWLEVTLALPEGILAPGDRPDAPPRAALRATVALRGHERVTLRFPLQVPDRGAYAIGPLTLRSGDWLGFIEAERTVATTVGIVAYPRALAVADHHRPSLRPLAEAAARRGLVPDPLRFRGVRLHRPGDPRKEIHWKLSARLGALQTKLYDPATSLDGVFLLNVASYEQYWIIADPEAVELVIAATAELVRLAAGAGRQVGLVTNGIDKLTHERPRSPIGRGPRTIARALEILARLGPYAMAAPETVFLRERGRLPYGATLVAVTPIVSPGLAEALLVLRRSQHRVLALAVTPPAPVLAARLHAADIQLETIGVGVGERRAAV